MAKCTRRKLTVENSHELHRNPYRDVHMALEWAKVHQLTCAQCRRRLERMNSTEYRNRWMAKRLANMAAGGAE